jgi:hypothetical protein
MDDVSVNVNTVECDLGDSEFEVREAVVVAGEADRKAVADEAVAKAVAATVQCATAVAENDVVDFVDVSRVADVTSLSVTTECDRVTQ